MRRQFSVNENMWDLLKIDEHSLGKMRFPLASTGNIGGRDKRDEGLMVNKTTEMEAPREAGTLFGQTVCR